MNLSTERGMTSVRAMKSLLVAKGDYSGAAGYAMGQGWDNGPERMLRGAVGAQSTQDGSGVELVGIPAADLMALVHAGEVASRIPGINRVPFDCWLVAETGAASAGWVGEGVAAPASRGNLAAGFKLVRRKLVSISPISDELARSSEGRAELTIQRGMLKGIIGASDASLIDVTNAGIDQVRPKSITYGAPTIVVAGSTIAAIDAGIVAGIGTAVGLGSTLETPVLVMHPISAAYLTMLRNTNGTPAYPELNLRAGGFLAGIPVLLSASVPRVGSPISSTITLLDGSRIWLASDPDMRLDYAKSAAIQMLDNPVGSSVAGGAGNAMVSMFQTSSVAVRGIRYMSWAGAPGAAVVLTIPF